MVSLLPLRLTIAGERGPWQRQPHPAVVAKWEVTRRKRISNGNSLQMCGVVEAGSDIPQARAGNTEKTLTAYWDLHRWRSKLSLCPILPLAGALLYSVQCGTPSFQALSPGGDVTLFERGHPLGDMPVQLTGTCGHMHTYTCHTGPHLFTLNHSKRQVRMLLGVGRVSRASCIHLCSFRAMAVLSPCLAPSRCSQDISELNCAPHIETISTESKYEKILRKTYLSSLHL